MSHALIVGISVIYCILAYNCISDAAKQSDDWEGRGEGDRGMVVPLLMKNKPPEGFETDERLNVELRPNEVSYLYYDSQGSCLVFQTMVFQLIFATLDMFFRENSNCSQEIEIPAGPTFRAIF